MAVNTITEQSLIAEDDIICYKAIYYDKSRKIWESKNRQQVFVYEPLPGDKLISFCSGKMQSHRINSVYFRSGTGGIHTYMDMKSAWYAVSQDFRFNDNRWKILIYRCIIPKGTEYYKSDDPKNASYMSAECYIKEKVSRLPDYQAICTSGTDQISIFTASNKASILKRAKQILNGYDPCNSGVVIRTRTYSEFIPLKNIQDK